MLLHLGLYGLEGGRMLTPRVFILAAVSSRERVCVPNLLHNQRPMLRSDQLCGYRGPIASVNLLFYT